MAERWRRLALLAAVLATPQVLAVPSTWAQGEVRVDREPEQAALVLMLVDDSDVGIVKRIRAELAALGFRLQTSPARAGQPAWIGLEDAARGAKAVAALRVSTSSHGVEVWVSDRVTGKTVLREIVTSNVTDADERDALIALRAVELLRASLLEVESTLPPRGEVKVPTPVREAARAVLPKPSTPDAPEPNRPWEPGMWLGVAGGIGWGSGASPSAHATMQASGRLHRWLAAEGALVAPLSAIAIDEPEGQATVLWSTLLLGLDVPLLPADDAWDLRVGGGIGVSWLHIESTALPPFSAASDDLFVSWPHAHVAVAWAPVERLRLVLSGRVGAATPRPVVQFAGREVLRYGRPLMLWSIGPEIALF